MAEQETEMDGSQMDETDLFLYWLSGELDADTAARVEVEDKADANVLGYFCVMESEGKKEGGVMRFITTFNDGSTVYLRAGRRPVDDTIDKVGSELGAIAKGLASIIQNRPKTTPNYLVQELASLRDRAERAQRRLRQQ